MASPPFQFKKFEIRQEGVAHPLGTDAVLLGAWAPVEGMRRALDIGAGTGILSLMLAQRNSGLLIDAVEIHHASVVCAAENFRRSPWFDRMNIREIPVQGFEGGPYDLIVSNPPFFNETIVSPDEHRQRARTGVSLKPIELIRHVLRLLTADGVFCAILPTLEGQRFQEMATLEGLYCNNSVSARSLPDKPVERLLLQFSRKPLPFYKSEIVLMTSAGRYSETFTALVQEFYL